MLPVCVQATLRRTCIRVLTRAGEISALRPITDRGMRLLFGRLAPTWDAIRSDPAYVEAFDHALGLLDDTGGPAPTTILDVACGTGLAAARLIDRYPAAQVTGVDIAPEMVELARSAIPSATFEAASSMDLPFPNASFDLVATCDGIFDVAELIRVCRPGGRILIVYTRGGNIPVRRSPQSVARELRACNVSVDVHDHEAPWVIVATLPSAIGT